MVFGPETRFQMENTLWICFADISGLRQCPKENQMSAELIIKDLSKRAEILTSESERPLIDMEKSTEFLTPALVLKAVERALAESRNVVPERQEGDGRSSRVAKETINGTPATGPVRNP
jgi:hypothetical protein